jgi:hypothetical protein
MAIATPGVVKGLRDFSRQHLRFAKWEGAVGLQDGETSEQRLVLSS